MKNLILGTAIFAGAAVVGGVGYKYYKGCPQFAEAACVMATEKVHQSGEDFDVTVESQDVTPSQITLNLSTNFMCPQPVSVRLVYDKSKLPNWKLGDLAQYAYTSEAIVNLKDGKGIAIFTSKDNPDLKLLPQGQYHAAVALTTEGANPIRTNYYKDVFNLNNGTYFASDSVVNLGEGFAAKPTYDKWLEAWLNTSSIAAEEGVTKQNLKKFTKVFGPAKITEEQGMMVYQFPETMHALAVDKATGKLVVSRRYAHEDFSYKGAVQK